MLASQPMASRRLVLPWPLLPMMPVTPSRQRQLGRVERAEIVQPEAMQAQRSTLDYGARAAYETRTGISRYRKSEPSLERITAGLSASRVSMITSSPGVASTPFEEVLGVERHRQLGALVLGVELLVGLADVLGDRRELEPVGAPGGAAPASPRGPSASPGGRASSSGSRPTVSWFGIARRDQPPVRRELALDQPGDQPHGAVADLEGGLPLAEVENQRTLARSSSRASSARARDGTSTVWPSASTDVPGKITQGQPVRVGGHQPQTALLGGQQHTGEDRPGVVGAGRRHHLLERRRELAGVDGDRVGRRRRRAVGTPRPAAPGWRTATGPT